jgi:hypothetical protein
MLWRRKAIRYHVVQCPYVLYSDCGACSSFFTNYSSTSCQPAAYIATSCLQDVSLATADSHELFRLSTSSAAVVVLMKSDAAMPMPGELEASLRRQRRDGPVM